MAKLIYTVIMSLDGYVADENGKFDWSMPDEAVHRFVNDLERPIGTYLVGRRMYEVMRYWEGVDPSGDHPAYARDYATIWQAADKIVYSTTLSTVSSARTRIEREFDSGAVRRMKADARADLSVAGPHLASQAIKAGLVDEYRLFISPIVIGGGAHFLPDGERVELQLQEEHRFANGVVYLRYATGG
jgi:dihydrofolate reductase